MEPLWSPVDATRGNRRQIGRPLKAREQAKSGATGCHRLPEKFHGKEGVSGSSPEEGLNTCKTALFENYEFLLIKEVPSNRCPV
jgi:hypothetical protein